MNSTNVWVFPAQASEAGQLGAALRVSSREGHRAAQIRREVVGRSTCPLGSICSQCELRAREHIVGSFHKNCQSESRKNVHQKNIEEKEDKMGESHYLLAH